MKLLGAILAMALMATILGCALLQGVSKVSSGGDEDKPIAAKSAKGLYLVKGSSHAPAKTEIAAFAGGCFWGIEDYMRKEPGVVATAVGFEGGHVANPSYRRVCEGDTGHAETCEVEFDPSKTSYEKLLHTFFEIHDPTEVNRQGPDEGEQYRSVVFYRSPEQKTAALRVIAKLQALPEFQGKKIATEVVPATPFYYAEDYHQQYVERGGRAYCHVRTHHSLGN